MFKPRKSGFHAPVILDTVVYFFTMQIGNNTCRCNKEAYAKRLCGLESLYAEKQS